MEALTEPAWLSVALPARATAGTGNPTLTTGDAPDSICPYGWKLPSSGKGNQSYSNLMNTYINRGGSVVNDRAVIAFFAAPINVMRTAEYSGSTLINYSSSDRDGHGRIWTNTITGAGSARSVRMDGFFYSNWDSSKGIGYTLRCLAR